MSFDLVIQGPLDKTSIDKVDDISDQFENIIISHWSENDSSLLQGLKSKNITINHTRIVVVLSVGFSSFFFSHFPPNFNPS